MISSIELNYDLSEEVNLVNFEQVVVQPNVEVFVHIPSLMPNIKGGSKSTSPCNSAGSGVFKNANNKPSTTSNTLQEQNFMTAKYSSDTTSDTINTVTTAVTSYLKESIDSEVQSISQKQFKYTINANSKLRGKFLNGKISKLNYFPTTGSDTVKEIV